MYGLYKKNKNIFTWLVSSVVVLVVLAFLFFSEGFSYVKLFLPLSVFIFIISFLLVIELIIKMEVPKTLWKILLFSSVIIIFINDHSFLNNIFEQSYSGRMYVDFLIILFLNIIAVQLTSFSYHFSKDDIYIPKEKLTLNKSQILDILKMIISFEFFPFIGYKFSKSIKVLIIILLIFTFIIVAFIEYLY